MEEQTGFGRYLLDEGLITAEQYDIALHLQNKDRLLGEIAVEMNYLKQDDIPAIMEYMEKNSPIMFGEAAISLGYINTNQLRYLLDIRTRRKIRVGDILLQEGFISEETLRKAVMSFHQKKGKLEKILIIDGSRTILGILKQMLTRYDYVVHIAQTGAAAFTMAREIQPDIAIVSGTLPDMEGYEWCRQMIGDPATRRMNLAILSTDNTPENVKKAFEIGVNHFLVKPIRENELINVIYEMESEVSKKRSEKILVVDDSAGPRNLISKELANAGYHIYQAKNGKEGLETAIQIRPDIITMDLEMPVMDGFEACRLLKNNAITADIPVIMISSSYSLEVVERGFEAGAIEFFAKPFKAGKLAEYINTLLETRKIRKNEKILVADDSATTRHIFKYLFSKNGFEVILAKDGEEALKLLPECLPDIVVTDCFMPGIGGIEFTRQVRAQETYRHIPIIMVTAAQKREDILSGLEAGANDYIIKPFDEAELIARVGVHLLNKKLFDEIIHERNKLETMYTEQNRLFHEITLLNSMDQKLQKCQNEEEAAEIISVFLQQFFSHDAGRIMSCDPAGEEFRLVKEWGVSMPENKNSFRAETCFALSKGRIYDSSSSNDDTAFQHCSEHHAEGIICIPLMAHEQFLGLIRLIRKLPDNGSGTARNAGERAKEGSHLMLTIAEHISLALANLRLQESLRYQSIRDPLTGLFNRRHMAESLEREISRMKRTGGTLGIIMLDVDFFKSFNDNFGHAAGDEVLKGLARLLHESTRQTDIACRYGGEEFMIILPGAAKADVAAKAEQLRHTVESEMHLEFSGKKISVTISLGVSIYPEHGNTITEVITQADNALYHAKGNGRNRVELAP